MHNGGRRWYSRDDPEWQALAVTTPPGARRATSADIEGFTSLAERLPPKAVVSVLMRSPPRSHGDGR